MLSVLLQVSQYFSTSDGPVTAQSLILHAGLVWPPVDLAQPDRAPARGQPSTESAGALSGSVPGLACGSPSGRSMGGHTLPTRALPRQFWGLAHPGDLPARRGQGL
jgi:hypothetical protein